MSAGAYRLPTYPKTTADVEVYVAAWRKKAAPLEKKLEWELIAFDPGYQFRLPSGQTISLPTEAVDGICKALPRKRRVGTTRS